MKNIIEFIKNQKSKEIQNINKDKDELLNKIKGLIEDFSNSRQKVFNETIEPVTLNLDTMSNDILFLIYKYLKRNFILLLCKLFLN